jgi:hypothetical protein
MDMSYSTLKVEFPFSPSSTSTLGSIYCYNPEKSEYTMSLQFRMLER